MRARRSAGWLCTAVLLALSLASCQGGASQPLPTLVPESTASPPSTAPPAKATGENLARALAAETPTLAVTTPPHTPSPSPPPLPTPAVTRQSAAPTPSPIASPTPPGPCAERFPDDNLLTVVTLDYALSAEYEPDDLVPIASKLPFQVTLGYPTEVRAAVLPPLVAMIEAMQAEGLQPRIMSGYRSYIAQALAWDKWNRLYPERAAIISAPPGHSEHQLGTVVDFGSPELAGLVGQPGIEFHTDFYRTSEGAWLAEHAHEFGFTLSYTRDSFEASGFFFEPWHFRYVGQAMAALLRDENLTLTEFQLANEPAPCSP